MNRRAMIDHKTLAAVLLAFTLPLGLAACGSGDASSTQAEAPPLEGAKLGGPFTLVDKSGKAVRWEDFAGQYRIVYFGYTFCPDACPFDMQKMIQGYDIFAKANPALAAKTQPIFITIDPARDTPEVVGQWTAAFSPRLMGLTGTPAQIDVAAKAFAAYYAKGKETPGGYLMDHTRMAYLMAPDGKPLALLPVDKDGAAVAAELEKWVK